MELIDFILNIDKYLVLLVSSYGAFVYAILFLIVFLETGAVITPFLPGDSLLFAAGAIAVVSEMNVLILFIVLTTAAILGDSVNYSVGRYFGKKFGGEDGKKLTFIKPENLEKTKKYFEKYGNKTIVFARFIPIVRTIAPFMAGFGEMSYANFIFYNIAGGIAWVSILLFGGYFFGNIPVVQENFSLVILIIIILSLMPAVAEWLLDRK